MYEKEIAESQVILLTLDDEDVQGSKTAFVKIISDNKQKICYVSSSKPYVSLKSDFASLGAKDLFFVDTLTMAVQLPPKALDCLFVQSPNSLVDISVAVTKIMAEKGAVTVVIDSISSMILYSDSHNLLKFFHNLINKVRLQNSRLALLVSKKDLKSELVQDLKMFVDLTI